MKILGIETSCDETAAAVVENGQDILSNVVVSQIDIFAEYGGVIPEVAARSHLEVINPVIDKALKDAHCTWDDIDAIAVTHAPGLLGSLLIGTLAARTLGDFKISYPLTTAVPSLGKSMVLIIRSNVDFPAPFSPKRPSISPVFTSKLTFFSACLLLKFLLILFISIITISPDRKSVV